MRVLVAQQPQDRVDAPIVLVGRRPRAVAWPAGRAERGDGQRDLLGRQHLIDHRRCASR